MLLSRDQVEAHFCPCIFLCVCVKKPILSSRFWEIIIASHVYSIVGWYWLICKYHVNSQKPNATEVLDRLSLIYCPRYRMFDCLLSSQGVCGGKDHPVALLISQMTWSLILSSKAPHPEEPVPLRGPYHTTVLGLEASAIMKDAFPGTYFEKKL